MSENNKHVNNDSPTPDMTGSVHSSSTEELEGILGPLGSIGESQIQFQAPDPERSQLERLSLTTS